MSFFQGMKTDSWQNYMHRQLDIGIFLSLDNDDKMDTIHFAGIKYHQTRESSSKITKCLHHREQPRKSIQKRTSIVFASDKKGKKVASTSEGEIGKGEMWFRAIGYRSYELFGPICSGLPSASVFSGLQTEQFYNRSFCFYYLSSLRRRLFMIVVFLV